MIPPLYLGCVTFIVKEAAQKDKLFSVRLQNLHKNNLLPGSSLFLFLHPSAQLTQLPGQGRVAPADVPCRIVQHRLAPGQQARQHQGRPGPQIRRGYRRAVKGMPSLHNGGPVVMRTSILY